MHNLRHGIDENSIGHEIYGHQQDPLVLRIRDIPGWGLVFAKIAISIASENFRNVGDGNEKEHHLPIDELSVRVPLKESVL
jgi:hypothetical protein